MPIGDVVLLIAAYLLVPMLIFSSVFLSSLIRDRQGHAPLHPMFLSQIIMIGTLLGWLILCVTTGIRLWLSPTR